MTSKRLHHMILSVLIAGATTSLAAAQLRPTRPKTPPIHISRLNSSEIVGALGRPLGEVATIEGIAADENYTRRKTDTGEILLRVQGVNGKPLKREIILSFRLYEGTQISRPAAGTRFRYVGYETGGFIGTPEAAFAYVRRTATTGYYFSTSLVILRDDSGSKTSIKTVPK